MEKSIFRNACDILKSSNKFTKDSFVNLLLFFNILQAACEILNFTLKLIIVLYDHILLYDHI